MWIYSQSTGELSRDGTVVSAGYSGNGDAKNRPDRQDVLMHGPIPRGRYTIGESFELAGKGPVVMRLGAAADNQMFGRSGFLIHGDSIEHPGEGSDGCIVLRHSTRLTIAASRDRQLEVVA